jgi:UPF0716 family protein affecting phage T7 exclusion
MARPIIAAILLLPLAEIVTFIAVAALVGFGTAILLMLDLTHRLRGVAAGRTQRT